MTYSEFALVFSKCLLPSFLSISKSVNIMYAIVYLSALCGDLIFNVMCMRMIFRMVYT